MMRLPSARAKWGLALVLVTAVRLSTVRASKPQAEDRTLFRELAAEVGLSFQHFIGATGSYFTPEIMGSGVALLDYDGDGDLDVYLLQGTLLDKTKSLKDSIFPIPQNHWPGNRLFRNEVMPSGKLSFNDITEQAGVQGGGAYGMGVAVGDYDNDGDPDLFVTNYGPNILYRNNGDGTFGEATKEAGLEDNSFSASATFLDYDRDGKLDLFVTRYNAFTVPGNKKCYNHAGGREYCGPGDYLPLHSKLYHNDGGGHFSDVTQISGIGASSGNGLGVVGADVDADGWIDIYVANDKTPNHLWINRRDGTFEDKGLISGAAYNGEGKALSGMGVSAGDFDNDGDEDIFVTNLTGETNTLYVNDGKGMFDDGTHPYGLGHTSLPYTGFGTLWFDYDNDGRLDLFAANGEVRAVDLVRNIRFPYDQRNQLFRNEGKTFREVTALAGQAFELSEVSRGAAFGDIDNDGDIDILVTNANGPVRLLLNQTGSRNHWLEVKTRLLEGNRDAYGSRVALFRKGRPPLWRRVAADGSYLSGNDPRVHFGLGTDAELRAAPLEKIQVIWPDGSGDEWKLERADQILMLRQRAGAPTAKQLQAKP
jgi:enediyne biosynthesis protein E4